LPPYKPYVFQMVQLDPLFREFVELLNSKKVEIMVVGGYARFR
jgi:2-hydroxy-3-keto-5-methylthiopentenyl-1-phosphate phosphatase